MRDYSTRLPENYGLLVHDLRYAEVYVFPSHAVYRVARMVSESRNVYFAGVFAGSFRAGRFRLSLDLAEHLYRRGVVGSVVVVDEQQERRFLYGHAVEGVAKRSADLGRMAVVVNRLGDVVGLGRYEAEGHRLVNLVDKGWYLRSGH